MRNQVFVTWDEISDDVEERTLPAENQRMLDMVLDKLPPAEATRIAMDLMDVWNAEEHSLEVGSSRTHLTLDNGTHLMASTFDDGRHEYALAWHPKDQEVQRDTLTAFSKWGQMEEGFDEEDEEAVRLADLINEITKKMKAATGV